MNEIELFNKLLIEFPNWIYNKYPFPSPYNGKDKIKVIILGADPTQIIDGIPKHFETVFDLDNWDKSPFWNMIRLNINLIPNLAKENIYVQNVCRNYFRQETTKNKKWNTIAREYWIPFLKLELDKLYSSKIPILMTTEFILQASLINTKRKINAENIYRNQLTIPQEENLFSRELLAFYRHPKYSLKNWPSYTEFISKRIEN